MGLQDNENEKNAAELSIANQNLILQNEEKEKRAAELIIANKELAYQNQEKEKRAAELALANKELAFQNKEKEKRAAELALANEELVDHYLEKELRESELLIANKELAFQNEEKENRAKELILINKQLASQKQQLEDFCNIISHNLRAPLVNISMLVDFLIESNEPEEQKQFSTELSKATRVLNDIFNELIESLQVKQDTGIKSEWLVLKDYIQRTCDTLQGQIKMSHAEITIDVEDVHEIYFPVKYLASILHNLVSNALKYASPDRIPIIKISAKKIGAKVLLTVCDNGLGIDTIKHKDNLFKIRKVFHAHPESKGFGLFITKTQIEVMGGEIWIESTPGKGSCFYVELKQPTS
jgi:light-regulated signal transduction histidine kinase (bacteriophytochrome)